MKALKCLDTISWLHYISRICLSPSTIPLWLEVIPTSPSWAGTSAPTQGAVALLAHLPEGPPSLAGTPGHLLQLALAYAWDSHLANKEVLQEKLSEPSSPKFVACIGCQHSEPQSMLELCCGGQMCTGITAAQAGAGRAQPLPPILHWSHIHLVFTRRTQTLFPLHRLQCSQGCWDAQGAEDLESGERWIHLSRADFSLTSISSIPASSYSAHSSCFTWVLE